MTDQHEGYSVGSGLVIGDRVARLVIVRRSPGGQLEANQWSQPIKAGIIREGRVIDGAAMTQTIADLLDRADPIVVASPVWLGIHPERAVSQTFDLTDVAPAEQEAVLGELVGDLVEDGYIGGWEIRTSGVRVRVTIVAVHRSDVTDAAQAAERAGLDVGGVELLAYPLLRATRRRNAPTGVLLYGLGEGGGRSGVAWLNGAPLLVGRLWPPAAGDAGLRTHKCDAATLDALRPDTSPQLSMGKAGWDLADGFAADPGPRLEALAASVTGHPADIDELGGTDPAGLGLALVASGLAEAPIDLLAAASATGSVQSGSSPAAAAGVVVTAGATSLPAVPAVPIAAASAKPPPRSGLGVDAESMGFVAANRSGALKRGAIIAGGAAVTMAAIAGLVVVASEPVDSTDVAAEGDDGSTTVLQPDRGPSARPTTPLTRVLGTPSVDDKRPSPTVDSSTASTLDVSAPTGQVTTESTQETAPSTPAPSTLAPSTPTPPTSVPSGDPSPTRDGGSGVTPAPVSRPEADPATLTREQRAAKAPPSTPLRVDTSVTEPVSSDLNGLVLTVSGAVPSQQFGNLVVAKAAAVVGPQNLVNAMVINPAVAFPEVALVGSANAVHFPFGSAEIMPEFDERLSLGVAVLKQNPTATMLIVGHTDSVGSEEFNLALSRLRAEAVVEFLVANGIDRSRLSSEGRGESEPVADNSTAEGRAVNRRIDAHISGLMD